MINAIELRIGNKFIGIAGKQTVLSIIDNTDNGKIEYKSEHHKLMYSHLILCEENGNQYKPCEIEGIPLTPDILEKIGFNYMEWEGFSTYLNKRVGLRKGYVLHNSIMDIYCFITNFGFPGHFGRRNTNSRLPDNLWDFSEYCVLTYLHQLQNAYFVIQGEELQIEL